MKAHKHLKFSQVYLFLRYLNIQALRCNDHSASYLYNFFTFVYSQYVYIFLYSIHHFCCILVINYSLNSILLLHNLIANKKYHFSHHDCRNKELLSHTLYYNRCTCFQFSKSVNLLCIKGFADIHLMFVKLYKTFI